MKKICPHQCVLFLDIDGVMNSIESCLQNRSNAVFTAAAISGMSKIMHVTDCRVVISSTWREDQMEKLRAAFIYQGLGMVSERIIDVTPLFDPAYGVTREDEIESWLHHNGHPERFAILDDDPHFVHLRPFLIQTSIEKGLTVELAVEVIELLGFDVGCPIWN